MKGRRREGGAKEEGNKVIRKERVQTIGRIYVSGKGQERKGRIYVNK